MNRPLYSQIAEHLMRKIKSRELQPYQQLPTEYELAEQFQVSRITSQRALVELEKSGWIFRERGKGSFVSPRDNEGGQAQEDYVSRAQNAVSMIIPYQDRSMSLIDYISGASDYLASRGYYLNVHTSNGSIETEKALLLSLPQSGVSGIIYYPRHDNVNHEVLIQLCSDNYPIVTIDKRFDVPISYVVSDNFTGGYVGVSHLIQLGHERIAYLSYNSIDSSSSSRNRYFGYCKGLKEHGLPIDRDIVFLSYSELSGGEFHSREFYKEMIEQMTRLGVTAIQANNDVTAIQLMNACGALGIRVPEQMSILGFDNIHILQHLDLPLTTIAQDFKAIGNKAAQMIVDRLEHGQTSRQEIVLPVELIPRQSSGRLLIREDAR